MFAAYLNFPMTLSVYVQNLNPFLIRFSGNFGIRWYGLAYVAGFVIAYFIIRWMTLRRRTQLTTARVGDFVVAVAIGTIVGGRLGYCLFYMRSLFTEFSSSFPFWGVLEINRGGMASHGGIIGIIIACIIYARRHKLSATHLLDLTTLGGTIGIFFGRIANFVNGELLGRAAPTGYPLAVKFPQEILDWANTPNITDPRFIQAEQIVQHINLTSDHAFQGDRYEQMLQAFRTNEQVARLLEPLLVARYPSQLFEALLEGAFLFIILFIIWRKPRKPGVIAGWFTVLYAAVRIFGEQFRRPDVQIGFDFLGLTRGQEISILMLLAGMVFLIYSARRPVPPIAGWGRHTLPATTPPPSPPSDPSPPSK